MSMCCWLLAQLHSLWCCCIHLWTEFMLTWVLTTCSEEHPSSNGYLASFYADVYKSFVACCGQYCVVLHINVLHCTLQGVFMLDALLHKSVNTTTTTTTTRLTALYPRWPGWASTRKPFIRSHSVFAQKYLKWFVHCILFSVAACRCWIYDCGRHRPALNVYESSSVPTTSMKLAKQLPRRRRLFLHDFKTFSWSKVSDFHNCCKFDRCWFMLDRSSFGATVCEPVCPMLLDCCLSCLSVCNVGVLWPNGWMDQD